MKEGEKMAKDVTVDDALLDDAESRAETIWSYSSADLGQMVQFNRNEAEEMHSAATDLSRDIGPIVAELRRLREIVKLQEQDEGTNVLIVFAVGSDSDVRLIVIRDVCEECLAPLLRLHEKYLGSDDHLDPEEVEAHAFLRAWRKGELPESVGADGVKLCGCQEPGRLVEISADTAVRQWAPMRIDRVIRTGGFRDNHWMGFPGEMLKKTGGSGAAK
jgi:hypothetical protein